MSAKQGGSLYQFYDDHWYDPVGTQSAREADTLTTSPTWGGRQTWLKYNGRKDIKMEIKDSKHELLLVSECENVVRTSSSRASICTMLSWLSLHSTSSSRFCTPTGRITPYWLNVFTAYTSPVSCKHIAINKQISRRLRMRLRFTLFDT